ncbi:selenium cofactor biosynthesis protein YqeC [Natranaerobius thermophilus]|uniref:Selenium-dependent hydroxylase accessory protein YqeC n=1 Tax=Natranaerobius thermophilus (strain ATCC BAA-1301 / DSM 18059 / JW/NM-WN-LF) TaxID=457570 RepID=B2A800_NATTJ|nr:selenium cofactor biosynthesis protein YqeC [Natranaerobius thermophilus]ACB85772.1 hypothetical protein Nther_2206 [Natranaerobius thermophilus JW/NM-WN-LF]
MVGSRKSHIYNDANHLKTQWKNKNKTGIENGTDLLSALDLHEHERVIGVIGGGGKTSLLYRLGSELHKKGDSVLLTTTTKMFFPHNRAFDGYLITSRYTNFHKGLKRFIKPSSLAQVSAKQSVKRSAKQNVKRSVEQNVERSVKQSAKQIFAGQAVKKDKVTGISPFWIDRGRDYFSEHDLKILVEADGSARLPLKLHNNFEPVLPASCDLVIVMAGIDALGKPLDQVVHRWELADELLKQTPENDLAPETIVDSELFSKIVLAAGHRARSQVKSSARIIPLINKLDILQEGFEIEENGKNVEGLQELLDIDRNLTSQEFSKKLSMERFHHVLWCSLKMDGCRHVDYKYE